ncbi:MAG: hypothetical protein HY822_18235 [Acidobacteria bacterium]|nr:hypothetical protein [Acidobacteriota bacterium]
MRRWIPVIALLVCMLGGTMLAVAQLNNCHDPAVCEMTPTCQKRNGSKWQSTAYRCATQCANGGYCSAYTAGICVVFTCSQSGLPNCYHQGNDD